MTDKRDNAGNSRPGGLGRIVILGCILLVSGCVEPVTRQYGPVPDRPEPMVYVQVDSLNLRRCPSVRCEILAVLHAGDAVTVRDSRNGWYEVVRPDNGRSGWLSSRYVAAVPPEKRAGRHASSGNGAPPQPAEELAAPAGGRRPPAVKEEFAPVRDASSSTETQEPVPPVEEEFAR